MNKTLTNEDLQDIQVALRVVVRDEVRKEIEPLRDDFSKLQSFVA